MFRTVFRTLLVVTFLFVHPSLSMAQDSSQDSDQNVSDDNANPPIARLGRLSTVVGDVQIKKAGKDDFVVAAMNLPVGPGDELKTGLSGSLEVNSDDGSHIRLWHSSSLLVTELYAYKDSDAITTRLALTEGEGYFSAAKKNESSVFIIETPTCTMNAANEAMFRVIVVKDTSTVVRDLSGQVEVAGGLDKVVLNGQQETLVDKGKSPTQPFSSKSNNDLFDQWNVAQEALLHPQQASVESGSDKYLPEDIPVGRRDLDRSGVWVDDAEYGYVWKPTVAQDWQPYTDGQWSYIEPYGWTWVSNESWGWVPYHYGAWASSVSLGWFWVPGHVWAPSWVVWNTGGAVVTWAPIHPYDDYWYWNHYCEYTYVGPYPYFGFYFGVGFGWHNYYPSSYNVGIDHHYYGHQYHNYPHSYNPTSRNGRGSAMPLNGQHYLTQGRAMGVPSEQFNHPGGSYLKPAVASHSMSAQNMSAKNWGSHPSGQPAIRNGGGKNLTPSYRSGEQKYNQISSNYAKAPAREAMHSQINTKVAQLKVQPRTIQTYNSHVPVSEKANEISRTGKSPVQAKSSSQVKSGTSQSKISGSKGNGSTNRISGNKSSTQRSQRVSQPRTTSDRVPHMGGNPRVQTSRPSSRPSGGGRGKVGR